MIFQLFGSLGSDIWIPEERKDCQVNVRAGPHRTKQTHLLFNSFNTLLSTTSSKGWSTSA